MIKEIRVINYNEGVATGTSYFTLTRPEESGFAIVNIDGLAPEDVQLSKTDYSFSDGTHFNQARLSSKEITISFVFQPRYELEETIEFKRHELYDIFRIKDTVRLIIITDELEVYIDGHVTSNKPEIFSEMEGAEIRIDCMDPYFKSDVIDKYVWRADKAVENGFEFPFENTLLPSEVGSEKHLTMAYFPKETEYTVYIPVEKRSQHNNGITIRIRFDNSLSIDCDSIKDRQLQIVKRVNGTILSDYKFVYNIGELLYDLYKEKYTGGIIPVDTLQYIQITTISGKKNITLGTYEEVDNHREVVIRDNLFKYIDSNNSTWFDIEDGDCVFDIRKLLGANNRELYNYYEILVERLYSGV